MAAQKLDATAIVETACTDLNFDLAHLVALASIWLNPEVIEMLAPVKGIWHPNIRRANEGLRQYGKKLEEVGQVINGITLDSNTYANTCFKRALGVDRRNFVGFHICHIWPGTAYDERCYTQLANLVAIPRELSSLTDHHPHIVACLKFRAWELYKWKPPKELQPVKPERYPEKWREPFQVNKAARKSILRRIGKDTSSVDDSRSTMAVSSGEESPVSRRRGAIPLSPFQDILNRCGFTNVNQSGRRFFSAEKNSKEYRFSVRVSSYSKQRNGWWFTFYDTDDRFNETTYLVGLMKTEADDRAVRSVALVISPKDIQEQLRHRKTWVEKKQSNRFDVTIPIGSSSAWDRWLLSLKDI